MATAMVVQHVVTFSDYTVNFELISYSYLEEGSNIQCEGKDTSGMMLGHHLKSKQTDYHQMIRSRHHPLQSISHGSLSQSPCH